jgi:hypothetical protein
VRLASRLPQVWQCLENGNEKMAATGSYILLDLHYNFLYNIKTKAEAVTTYAKR